VFDLFVAALQIVSHPLALAGFIALGVVATSVWRAAKYGLMWGLAVQLFDISLGRTGFALEPILFETILRLTGAVIVTVGIHALARWLRRRSARTGRG
jgi:hypothetical protein